MNRSPLCGCNKEFLEFVLPEGALFHIFYQLTLAHHFPEEGVAVAVAYGNFVGADEDVVVIE